MPERADQATPMSFVDRLRSTDGRLESVVRALLPGQAPAIEELRRQVCDLCSAQVAHGALILGPYGSGKSTIARTIAAGRYFNLLTPGRVNAILQHMVTDAPARLSSKQLPWFGELSLAGLVESLADAQLFGMAPRAATGVDARKSIFEVAAQGQISSRAGGVDAGSRATGGVVFLDEIGDLSKALQPKLLGILTGAPVYRVGGEGQAQFAIEFKGLTLAATWRSLETGDLVRPDLLSRFSDYVVRVPSLSERVEDIPDIAVTVVADVEAELATRQRELQSAGIEDFDRERVMQSFGTTFRLSKADLKALQSADWSAFGELRGLSQILRRCRCQGMPVQESMAQQLRLPQAPSSKALDIASIFDELLRTPAPHSKTVRLVGDVEGRVRDSIAALVRQDPRRAEALAHHLGIPRAKLMRELQDLNRRRTRR